MVEINGPKAQGPHAAAAACAGQCGTSAPPGGSSKRHRRAAASRGYRLLPATRLGAARRGKTRRQQRLAAAVEPVLAAAFTAPSPNTSPAAIRDSIAVDLELRGGYRCVSPRSAPNGRITVHHLPGILSPDAAALTVSSVRRCPRASEMVAYVLRR